MPNCVNKLSGSIELMRVSLKHIPKLPTNCMYWERASDPFHPKALNNGLSSTIKTVFNTKAFKAKRGRKSGWMAIDANDNAVLFLFDDTILPKDFLGAFDLKINEGSKIQAYAQYPETKDYNFISEYFNKEQVC